MANASMVTVKVAGIVLIVIGAGAIFWGYQLSGSIGAQISEAISGAASDEIMSRYIGGAASLVAGLYLFFMK